VPLFEYRCPACDREFELLILGTAVPACPTCGSTSIEKLLSMFAVSSDGTQLRSREKLGVSQRARSAANRQEREHFKHDHHDD
jgi:putative FmdB family regulatory protein